MAKQSTLMWIQRLVWIYIYGGLLTVVLSLFMPGTEVFLTRSLQCVGGFFVVLGIVLIYVRSRLKLTP
jgi:preprotein translocase subunit SecG